MKAHWKYLRVITQNKMQPYKDFLVMHILIWLFFLDQFIPKVLTYSGIIQIPAFLSWFRSIIFTNNPKMSQSHHLLVYINSHIALVWIKYKCFLEYFSFVEIHPLSQQKHQINHMNEIINIIIWNNIIKIETNNNHLYYYFFKNK